MEDKFDIFIHLSVAVNQSGVDMIEQIGTLKGFRRLQGFKTDPRDLEDLRKAVAKATCALECYDAAIAADVAQCTTEKFYSAPSAGAQ